MHCTRIKNSKSKIKVERFGIYNMKVKSIMKVPLVETTGFEPVTDWL